MKVAVFLNGKVMLLCCVFCMCICAYTDVFLLIIYKKKDDANATGSLVEPTPFISQELQPALARSCKPSLT